MPVAQSKTPAFPPWTFTEGAGWTLTLGELHLHVWQAPETTKARYQDPAAFPWSIRLKGFLVAADWTAGEGTSSPAHSMESAENTARAFAEAILADLPSSRPREHE